VTDDARFMRLALRLGRRGLGRTSPNPPVGAVVVRGRRVVGSGHHRRAGGPHAEIEALGEAGSRARGATLYVTLEPCNHHGRTPPCTEAVLAAGIRRVVFGVRDPNPHVRGAGARRLRRGGVEVQDGVEAAACRELIGAFARHATSGLPLVTLKLAASLDGRIATRTGASRWISGPAALRFVHRERNRTDAVMVGAGTVITDDPELTCRIRGGRDPLRVVVDGRLRIPLTARVLTNGAARGTLIATVMSKGSTVNALRRLGATVVVLPGKSGALSLRRLLRELGRRGVTSVLIEGGSRLAAGALREGVVDRLLLFLAPKLIGGDGIAMIGPLDVLRPANALALRDLRVSRLGEDVLIRASVGEDDAR
jgi:diaminohydroxyphosphoribosylaminopyrimidine deaminase/5-amino-6-(5-phosphoribosylamino)uracil reductase